MDFLNAWIERLERLEAKKRKTVPLAELIEDLKDINRKIDRDYYHESILEELVDQRIEDMEKSKRYGRLRLV